MIFEILDTKGKVQNTIVAEPDFVEKNYKGLYRDVTPKSIPVEIVEDDMTKIKKAIKAIATKLAVTVDL